MIVAAVFLAMSVAAQSMNADSLMAEILKKDQSVRQELVSLQEAGATVEELLPVITRMTEVDYENQMTALPLLDKYLARKISLADSSLRAMFYVIQHADGDIQMKYRDFVRMAYDGGVLTGTEYAFFVDRLNVSQNKAQVYGCQSHMNFNLQDQFLFPILNDPNPRRAEVGLPNLESQLGDTFVDEYAPQYVSDGEYVIFGHIMNASGGGVSAKVVIGKIEVSTNAKGFYVVKSDRKKVPGRLQVIASDGSKYTARIRKPKGADWEMIDLTVN